MPCVSSAHHKAKLLAPTNCGPKKTAPGAVFLVEDQSRSDMLYLVNFKLSHATGCGDSGNIAFFLANQATGNR